MTHSYYQFPSPIGKPILDLFLDESDYKEDCIHTIWFLERKGSGSFNQYSAIKYIWRLGQKDPDYRSDLNKAIEYLTWDVESISGLARELADSSEKAGIEDRLDVNLARLVSAVSISVIENAIAQCKLLKAEYKSCDRKADE